MFISLNKCIIAVVDKWLVTLNFMIMRKISPLLLLTGVVIDSRKSSVEMKSGNLFDFSHGQWIFLDLKNSVNRHPNFYLYIHWFQKDKSG